RLGLEHILTGADHLLFVLGLLLLIAGMRPLFWTLTAFTLGHSVTLSLAVLGFVHVPQAYAEAAIALSIFVLAVELARAEGSPPHARRPPAPLLAPRPPRPASAAGIEAAAGARRPRGASGIHRVDTVGLAIGRAPAAPRVLEHPSVPKGRLRGVEGGVRPNRA